MYRRQYLGLLLLLLLGKSIHSDQTPRLRGVVTHWELLASAKIHVHGGCVGEFVGAEGELIN